MPPRRQDIDPVIWGSTAWGFINGTIDGLSNKPTKKEARGVEGFVDSLETILPCKKCRENFRKYKQKHPLTEEQLGSKAKIREWFNDYRENHQHDKPGIEKDDIEQLMEK